MKFNFNLYKILEVDDKVSFEGLKKAYRKLSQKYHPDKPDTGDEEIFKKISIAYSILSNLEKRKLYDLGKWDELEPESKIELSEAEQNIIALVQSHLNNLHTGELQGNFLPRIIQNIQDILRLEIDKYKVNKHVWADDIKSLEKIKSRIKFKQKHTNYNLVMLAITQLISLKEDEIQGVTEQLNLAEEMYEIIQDFNFKKEEDSKALKKFLSNLSEEPDVSHPADLMHGRRRIGKNF